MSIGYTPLGPLLPSKEDPEKRGKPGKLRLVRVEDRSHVKQTIDHPPLFRRASSAMSLSFSLSPLFPCDSSVVCLFAK